MRSRIGIDFEVTPEAELELRKVCPHDLPQACTELLKKLRDVPSEAEYFFQVAAVRLQEDGAALLDALKSKRYPAFLATVGSDTPFRVEVGPFTDIKAAESARLTLVSDGYKPLETVFHSTVGDLGLPSGPVAHSREELESLKNLGQDTYTIFSLSEGMTQPASHLWLCE
jgi:hypothetical protein